MSRSLDGCGSIHACIKCGTTTRQASYLWLARVCHYYVDGDRSNWGVLHDPSDWLATGRPVQEHVAVGHARGQCPPARLPGT